MPAEKEELVSVAKAMHREKFTKNTKELFHLEKEAALKSIQTGGWELPCRDPRREGAKSLCGDASHKDPQQGPSSQNSGQLGTATRGFSESSLHALLPSGDDDDEEDTGQNPRCFPVWHLA